MLAPGFRALVAAASAAISTLNAPVLAKPASGTSVTATATGAPDEPDAPTKAGYGPGVGAAADARELLGSADPARRLAGIAGLGALALPEGLRLIERLLDDPEASCRMAAARMLARAGDSRALARLAAGASDGRVLARIEALTALREASALPAAARQAVLRALVDQETPIRLMALDILRSHPDRDAVPTVAGALDDPSREVRLATIGWLGAAGDGRAVLPLLQRIDAADREVRVAIIDALGRLPGPGGLSAGPAVARQLQSPDGDVRAVAIEALGRLRFAGAVPALARLASSRAPDGGRAAGRAALALGSIGGAEAIDVLTHLLRQPAPALEVVEALRRLGPPAVSAVAATLADGFPSSAIAAASVLGAIGDRAATAALAAAVARRPAVAAAAAYALGRIADPAAVPALVRATGDPGTAGAPSIRQACLEALAAIGDIRAAAAVAPAATDDSPAVRRAAVGLARALGGGLSRDQLRARLGDPDLGVRLSAIAAAGALPDLRPADLLLGAAERLSTPDAEESAEARAIADAIELAVSEADRARLLAGLASPHAANGLPSSGARAIVALRALAALPPDRRRLPAAVEAALVSALARGDRIARAAAEVLARTGVSAPAARRLVTACPSLEPGTRARLCPSLVPASAARGPAWLRVRLVTADGRPAAGRSVAVAAGGGVLRWAPTDDRGEAWVTDLPADLPADLPPDLPAAAARVFVPGASLHTLTSDAGAKDRTPTSSP